MTYEFIQQYCVNCDKCIMERTSHHYFYPYLAPAEFTPTYCGEITEEGGLGIRLDELETCPKILQ